MAEGNKINYSLDKPEYEYTTSTTQFDDELMKRGIVSFEQAMMAKGATPQEARRLANIKEFGREEGEGGGDGGGGDVARVRGSKKDGSGNDDNSSTSASEDEDENEGEDDDEFLTKYRQMRLKEMQEEYQSPQRAHPSHGEVMYISRSDWTREVNDASQNGRWVVINLTRGSSSAVISTRHVNACQAVEYAATDLARKYPDVKFVAIAATAANENWPPQNLPTMFCYRGGKLQHQLVGLDDFGGHGINSGRIEWRLAQLGVLETDLEYDIERSDVEFGTEIPSSGHGRSQFGGIGSTWATRRDSDDDDS